MENGTIGESRARSFLIDRFWILERSVDIHGADLLIQRRVTSANILDPAPPRFGVVQAKFYESDGTTQYVPRNYLVDAKGKPQSEFFVLCFTGSEDSKVIAFITASEVINRFNESAGDKAGQYALPFKAVFTDEFTVKSQAKTLDRIEQSLRYADIIGNRQYVLNGLSGTMINPHTDPLFEEPIDNPNGPIPETFLELKKSANSAMYEVEDFYDLLLKIVSASNPEAALAAYKEVRRAGFGVSVRCTLEDQYLEDAVRHHKEVHSELTKAGLLKAYLALQDSMRQEVIAKCSNNLALSDNTVRVLTVRYDPKTLAAIYIELRLDGKADVHTISKDSTVVSSKAGEVITCSGRSFLIMRHFRRQPDTVADLPNEEHARQSSWILVRPAMAEIHKHLFGHEPGMADFD
jgi:hypothetical protein